MVRLDIKKQLEGVGGILEHAEHDRERDTFLDRVHSRVKTTVLSPVLNFEEVSTLIIYPIEFLGTPSSLHQHLFRGWWP